MSARTKNEKELEFLRNFINAVYGILLGYGFGNAIWQIYESSKSPDHLLISSFCCEPQKYCLLLFAIIVLCIHWWDWRLGVSEYVTTNILEFIINILILLNIEWLFFEYDSFLNFSFLMATLALFNFLWVVNFRILRFKEQKECGVSLKKYMSQKMVRVHISKRFLGVLLYSALFFAYIFSNQKCGTSEVDEWASILVLFGLFLFDRIILYRNRKVVVGEEVKEF